MAIGESAGLLFKIKGDSSDAVRAFKETEAAQTGLTGSTVGLTSSFSSLAGPALAAGAAVTVIATAAIAGTRALFDLTKSAAEFGSQIFDASQKTGLSAERLSAMKFAADQSGTSLDSVTAATARFSKVIGDAGNGSEEAQKKLARLGVTSTDLDTALKQALATIVKVPPGAQQMALAMDAFGKSGADLLPFIKSFDGDLDALTAKAKELGVTITDEAAAAADEFGDQLDTLNAQFGGVGRTIGNAFMPIFLEMAKSLSDFLSRNQSEIAQWGQGASDTIRGVIIVMQTLDQVSRDATNNSLAAWTRWGIGLVAILDPLQFTLTRTIGLLKMVGSASRGPAAFAEGVVSPLLGIGGGGGVSSGGGGGRRGGGGGGGRAPRDTSQQDAERLAARDLAAGLKIELGNLRTIQEGLTKDLDDLLSKAQQAQTGLLDFRQQTAELVRQRVANLQDSLAEIEKIERAQLKADATENERNALKQAQDERRKKLREDIAGKLEKIDKDHFDNVMKRLDDEYNANERLLGIEEERRKRFEEDAGFGGIPDLQPPPILTPDGEEGGFFGSFLQSWKDLVAQIYLDAPTLEETFQTMGDIFTNAFDGMANAIGGVVQQWVLYGNTGPAIMRKILATALATIAAESAVQAIKQLAYGFAALAFQDYEAAALHFGSAALFGSIAGVAALAGRAVAGNAFKQNTGSAAGRSGASGASRSSGDQGAAYSSYGNEVLVREQGRNATASQPRLLLTIKDDSRWLGNMLKAQIEENGQVRDLIRSAAEA